jgi:hypothetical protein
MQCKKTKQNEKTPCLEQIATIIKIKILSMKENNYLFAKLHMNNCHEIANEQ